MNGWGKKWPIEKMPKEKIIIWRVIFRRLLTSSWIFFTLIGFNILMNFIKIIWLKNLLMLFKATSAYHSRGFASWTSFNFRACLARYLIQKKTVKGKILGLFFPRTSFPGHFFPIPYFSSPHFQIDNISKNKKYHRKSENLI